MAGIERKADAGSATMLSGTAHVILEIKQPDGSLRQIRLHSEGVWTLGASRRRMDEFAQRIVTWQQSGATA
jgi:hypothetical protein